MNKKLFFSVILVMVLLFVISCGQTGGTIVIENDIGSPTWAVYIGSSPTRSSDDYKNLPPGQKYEKTFVFDGTYYAFGKFTSGWKTKAVYLSGGETVILTGDDF